METNSTRAHWDGIYGSKGEAEQSWHRAHLEVSLEWIRGVAPTLDQRILDAGGGSSTLAQDLVALGYQAVTVVDLSVEALRVARERMGENAARVRWIAGNLTEVDLEPGSVDVWHDRAVFHFLTEERERAAYVRQMLQALRHGGHAIVATFAADGPERCSGLPVQRYSAETLAAALGSEMRLLEARRVEHRTPWGIPQSFVYTLLQRA